MRLIDWILPLNVKNFIKKVLKKDTVIPSIDIDKLSINKLLEANKELINSVGTNKTCYILACGPSINEMDLSILKGKDCISVSNFFVHPLYNEIQPKYHVFAPTHEPITEQQYNSWITDYSSKTNFKTKLILNAFDREITDKVAFKEDIKRYYYELTDKMPEFYNDIQLDQPLPRIQTVVHIAIYAAFSLGYKEIRLLGVDHNWLLTHGKSSHFYKENESELTNKGYVEYNEDVDWELQLQCNLNLWKVYKSIKKYTKTNIRIINNTENSLLDVFPKESLK